MPTKKTSRETKKTDPISRQIQAGIGYSATLRHLDSQTVHEPPVRAWHMHLQQPLQPWRQ